MKSGKNKQNSSSVIFPKSPSGIKGLDDILGGGLPTGRPTLVCGAAGCGKTLLAMEFLVRGVTEYQEPGVFISFEESAEDLIQNVASLGFDLPKLIEDEKLILDFVYIEKSEIEETGEYDLEPLFIRLGSAIDSIGAKRVAMDTIESLFSGLSNESILRAEIRRLFRWLKKRGITAVITGESGSGERAFTRHGLEEYVSDCVIFLDHRVDDQVSTRRMKVVKYRGSLHGTNEYPFLIDRDGITVLPITSLTLDHQSTSERISTGIDRLDSMLEGKGFYHGSSILVSGSSGTGKTSVASYFADATCRDGKKCLYFAFEESPHQIVRNMSSIGLDLQPWIDSGLLHYHASRPSMYGLESHLAVMLKMVNDLKPDAVIVDPISNLVAISDFSNVRSMFTRLIDYLKVNQVTALFTNLSHRNIDEEKTDVGISSLIDTWILLMDMEANGERNRGLYVLKSRGMAHSNQIREFILSNKGISLIEPYVGPGGVLTGSARYQQESIDAAQLQNRQEEVRRRQLKLESRKKAIDAQIAALQAEFEMEKEEMARVLRSEEQQENAQAKDRTRMATLRGADV